MRIGFTADALRQAAAEADFTPEEIDRATELMAARQRADEQVLPLRRQARWIVIGAYVIVWLLFGAVFLTQRVIYNAGVILQGILTVALLIALGLSLVWVRGRHPEPSTVVERWSSSCGAVHPARRHRRPVPPVHEERLMLALRPYLPLRMVLTVCGHCFSDDPDREIDYETDILQGNLVAMDGAVYLRRTCRRGHGEVMSLYEEDHRRWEYLQQWRTPTREIIPDTQGNAAPIPMGYADGLGDLQTQHSCVLLLDITENCNLECPTCFAAAAPGIGRFARLPHILRSLDASIEREGGRVDVLMLSGGEPTVHPEVLEIIEAATERNVTRVILNTNGIRIAKDDRFVAALGRLRGRVEVYLQFDGFELESHLYHRGEDLRDVKADAIRRLASERVFTTLAVAVAEGVNDVEVGAIADYALATDYIAGVAFQPVFGSGRSNPIDPMRRVDDDRDVAPARRADRGSCRAGRLHRAAVLASRLLVDHVLHPRRRGEWRSVPRMLGADRLKEYLGLVSQPDRARRRDVGRPSSG